MAESLDSRLKTIDEVTIARLAKSALNSDTAELVEWRFQPMTAGIGGGSFGTSLYRLSGLSRDRGVTVPWTMILKILHSKPDSKPGDSHYWRREADAYQSGLFNNLPPCVAAPRCFAVTDYPNESWIWLEDVKDELARWPLQRYGLAARHLGQFNATYVTAHSLPTWPWLSAGWIRDDIKIFGVELTRFYENLKHPLVRRFVPSGAAGSLLRLWEQREAFLEALDALPQTLCHLDAFRRNMFARRTAAGDQTVLIDWAFLGPGPIGAEIVSMVMVTLMFTEVPVSDAPNLDQVVFDGYLMGLRDGGWLGDAQQARLGYTAAIALRRMATIGYMLSMILDERRHAAVEEQVGLPIGEFGDHVSRVGEFVDTLAREARRLVGVA